jgi:preprotein translocase subunit SecF
MKIELDRGLANSLGISVNDAAQALRVAFAGVEVGDWVDPAGETRDVSVRLHPDDRVDASNIERLPIAVSGTNRMVPLEQIATVTMGKGPSQIQHADGKRTISVAANAQGRSPGEVTADAMKLARAMSFPPGYGLELAGTSRDQQEVFKEMTIALVMGVALMYLILVMQFGSFTAPLAVMLSLPLSLIGVVLALLLTNSTLNLMSFIGVIMLMGLVAKNAILLLDAARAQEAQGVDREEALMAAGRKRLRPILMTTFALIAGMLPVAIGVGEGGEFYRPMAVAIIGGTITSTLLTLLVVPSFYDSIETSRDRAVAKLKKYPNRRLYDTRPAATSRWPTSSRWCWPAKTSRCATPRPARTSRAASCCRSSWKKNPAACRCSARRRWPDHPLLRPRHAGHDGHVPWRKNLQAFTPSTCRPAGQRRAEQGPVRPQGLHARAVDAVPGRPGAADAEPDGQLPRAVQEHVRADAGAVAEGSMFPGMLGRTSRPRDPGLRSEGRPRSTSKRGRRGKRCVGRSPTIAAWTDTGWQIPPPAPLPPPSASSRWAAPRR